MSRRANPLVIGSFVVGALVLAVAAVLILAGGQLLHSQRTQYVMYFHGSVKGLNVGSPVMFRGVSIGTVTSIQLVVNKKEIDIDIPVIVEVDNTRFVHSVPDVETRHRLDELIKAGMRAQLELQSLLTGQLFIQVDFYPGTPVVLVNDPMYKSLYEEIPTIRTPIEKLGKSLQEFPIDQVLASIANSTKGLDKLVNSPELQQSIVALHAALQELRSLAGNINAQVDPLAASANSTLLNMRKALDNLDSAITEARAAVQQANSTLKTADKVIDDPELAYQLNNALQSITAAANSIRLLANSIERQPDILIKGRH
jgi:paraquat-inducible protein B